jgi:hypothetical protein
VVKQTCSCMKRKGTEHRDGELRTTGSGISQFLNIQNQKYATVACAGCGYTELYRLDGSGIGNIVDLFTN